MFCLYSPKYVLLIYFLCVDRVCNFSKRQVSSQGIVINRIYIVQFHILTEAIDFKIQVSLVIV